MHESPGEPNRDTLYDVGDNVDGNVEPPDPRLADVLAFPRSRPSGRRHDSTSESSTDGRPRLRDVIGDVLRAERLDQGRTLVDVASDAAVSLPYLSEVERGRKEASSDVVAAICDALDLPLVDVLERSADRLRGSGVGGTGLRMLAA